MLLMYFPQFLVVHVCCVVAVVPKHVPGRAGGGWDDLEPQGEGSGSRSEGSSDMSDRLEPGPSQDWAAEEQLVNEALAVKDTSQFLLTLPELRQFKRGCAGLNCEKVVDSLRRKLSATCQQTVMVRMLVICLFKIQR